MKIKKIIAAVISAALGMTLLSACGNESAQSLENIKKSGKITMYTNAAFPPFEYTEGDGGIVGVDADIAKEIAKDIGVELEIQNVEFTSVLAAIQSGKGSFGAAGITVNPEREEAMDFSIKYVTSRQYIIMPESENSINTLEDFAGKKIGTQEGTTGDITIKDEISGIDNDDGTHTTGILEGSGATCTSYSNGMNAAQDILTGRLDAVIIDQLPAESIVENNKGLRCIELVYLDGRDTMEEYAICVEKGNTELLEQINKTLKRLIDEGKIEEFLIDHTTRK